MRVILELISELWKMNAPATLATICLMAYFFGMFLMFLISPIKNAKTFSVQPTDNAGITELRVYYGGIQGALALFLGYLMLALKNPLASLIGGMMFATTVFVTRFIFTFVDKGWKCTYTKLAIPAEGVFVIALWICYTIQHNMY